MGINKSKINLLHYIFPQCREVTTLLLSLSLTTSIVFGQTLSSLKILVPNAKSDLLKLDYSFDIDQTRPGVPSNPPTNQPSNSGQTRPGVPSNPPTNQPNNSPQTRPGLSSGSGALRPGLGGTVGLRPGLSISRPGLSAVTRPGLERSQALGVQQAGEETAQATRRVVSTGPSAILKAADNLVNSGDVDKAIDKYQQIIKDNPSLASAYAGLGYAYIQAENFDAALEVLRTAIDKDKNDKEAQLNLGVALYRGGNIAEAIKQYKSLIEDKFVKAEAHYNLGIAYAHEGEFENAITEIKIAINKNKNKYPEAYNNLGLIYEARAEEGDAKKAIESLETAIAQKNKEYPIASYNLARLYLNRGTGKESKIEAINQYKAAIKQKANFAEAYLDLGNTYIFLTVHSVNSLDDALKAYQDALKIRDGIYPLAHENLAITYSKKGDKEEALKHYYIAFEQYDGRCPEALQNLITTLEEGQFFTVSNELLKANNAASLINKQTKKLKEKNDQALGKKNDQEIDEIFFRTMKNLLTYESVDEATKDNPLARYCGARAYAFVGNWQSATSELIRAIELAKKDPKNANKTINNQQINVTEDAERALIIINSNNLVAMLP